MAKDKIHYIVKESLIKNGWKITHDYFHKAAIQKAVKKYLIKIIVIDIENQNLLSWII